MSLKMRILPVVGAAVIRLLGTTWRLEWDSPELLVKARAISPKVIFVSWHGRMLPMSYSHRDQGVQMIASEHEDGEIFGQTIRRLGFGHVRGSSTRGGARAIRELVRKIRDGFDVGATIDGPRGPRYVVKPGPLLVAKLTGAAIVPITSSSRRHKTLSSWDAFELPAPFTRVYIKYGEPLVVPRHCDDVELEDYRQTLERRLRAITEESDRSVAE